MQTKKLNLKLKHKTQGNKLKLIANFPDDYSKEYYSHLFEQYKLCVEMADRTSLRRTTANTFFLSVHTALVAAFTIFLKEKLLPNNLVGILPFLAVIVLCYVWWRIIYSYKQLNSGKFKVIHEMEKLLPLAPYAAEWKVLGEGKDKSRYYPLSHIENYVPICFALFYIFIGVSYYSEQIKNLLFIFCQLN